MAKDKNSPEEEASGKPTAKARKSPAKKAAVNKPAEAVAAAAAESAASGSAVERPRPSQADMHEEIRLRAYQIYCERGGHHGMHDADWHRAELEVRAKYSK